MILKVKLEEVDKKKIFLMGEVKYLTVLLNAEIQTSSHNSKTYERIIFTRNL